MATTRIAKCVDCSSELGRAMTCFVIMIILATSGCRAEVPATNVLPPEIAPIDRLLELMRERLVLMHDVARTKWNEQKPVADLDREKRLLDRISENALELDLDPAWVRTFFAAQIEAAKVVQQADFERWKSTDQSPFPDAPDLAILRKQIDQLNADLLAALKQALPLLNPQLGPTLNRRIDAVLGKEVDAKERDLAVEPLRKRTEVR